jgi:beta-lactamase class A
LRSRGPLSALRFISLALLLAAIILTVLQLVRFSRVRAYLPAGLIVAGVPVGGLDRQQAAERLLEVYSTPVELHYGDAAIQLNPSVVDFRLDVESMLAVANLERTQKQFWQDFYDYLWGHTTYPSEIPLSASFSEPRLRVFLAEIAARYDQPPTSPMPIPGTTSFAPGTSGTALDQEGSVILIQSALVSLDERVVTLPLRRTNPSRPSFQNLQVLLRQTLQVSGFDGLAGIYLLDLQTAQEIHFAYRNGEDVPVTPDIAFTASSIIKIPIMVTAYKQIGDNPDEETLVDGSGDRSTAWSVDRERNNEDAGSGEHLSGGVFFLRLAAVAGF